MAVVAIRTIQITNTSTILQRIGEKDKTAVKDCIDTYGNFIWTLARKYTATKEEAETAAQEIFIDIWQNAECSELSRTSEKLLIAKIALRRLIKYSQLRQTVSMSDIDTKNEQG